MDASKLYDKLEKLHEKMETLELNVNDPNESEFNTLKADVLVLFSELEELTANSIEQEAIAESDAPSEED